MSWRRCTPVPRFAARDGASAPRTSPLVLTFVLWSACSCGHSARSEARVERREHSAGAAEGLVAVDEAAAGAEAPPREPPDVELRAEVDPYARVALRVSNRSTERQHLSSTLLLERSSGEAFTDAELGTFHLGEELASEGCIELVPGAELRATWSCLRADAEGLVRECAMAPAGNYRFVAQGCERSAGGPARAESPAFEFVPR